MAKEIEAGHLHVRQEGPLWVAYFDAQKSGGPRFVLGAINVAAVSENKARETVFIELMKAAAADLVKTAAPGLTLRWGEPQDRAPSDRPEH